VGAGPGITISNVNVANATTLTAQLVVSTGATLGPRSITVMNRTAPLQQWRQNLRVRSLS